jgi:hypothetical protein
MGSWICEIKRWNKDNVNDKSSGTVDVIEIVDMVIEPDATVKLTVYDALLSEWGELNYEFPKFPKVN